MAAATLFLYYLIILELRCQLFVDYLSLFEHYYLSFVLLNRLMNYFLAVSLGFDYRQCYFVLVLNSFVEVVEVQLFALKRCLLDLYSLRLVVEPEIVELELCYLLVEGLFVQLVVLDCIVDFEPVD